MMGIPAGLLGVGGGFVAVPAQQLVLGTRLRNAIANSSSLIIFSAAVGAVYKNWTLSTSVQSATVAQSLRIAALLIPGAILGSYLGALFMHISPIRVIRSVFICYLLWAGYSQWTAKPSSAVLPRQDDHPASARPSSADLVYLNGLIERYQTLGGSGVAIAIPVLDDS